MEHVGSSCLFLHCVLLSGMSLIQTSAHGENPGLCCRMGSLCQPSLSLDLTKLQLDQNQVGALVPGSVGGVEDASCPPPCPSEASVCSALVPSTTSP